MILCLRRLRLAARRERPMTQNNLVGKTILVVEDQFTILLDLKDALEEAGGRVLLGSQHVEHPDLSAAVLDRAEPIIADRLTERGLPFVFYTGRQSNEFARWPHVPVLVKPASVTRIVSRLAELLHPQKHRCCSCQAGVDYASRSSGHGSPDAG